MYAAAPMDRSGLPLVAAAVLLILSPFVGSFLGVLIDRLPARRPIVIGRSRCDSCGQTLSAIDLVPVLSWLALKGRCRHCARAIDWDLLAVEIAAIAMGLWAVIVLPGWLAFAGACLGWTLLALAAIDARTCLLPDQLTLPLALGGLAVSWVIDPALVIDHLIGVAVGFAAFATVAALYRAWRGRDGLGVGDAKMLGALGAWVGWQGLPTVVLYASGTALLWALAWALVQLLACPHGGGYKTRLDPAQRLPFGPFLGLAGWLVWLYGPLSFG